MKDFVYYYKTSDGERHEGEIKAADREAAFKALREDMGIRAIKVVPKGLTEEGAKALKRKWIKSAAIGGVSIALVAGGGAWALASWWAAKDAPVIVVDGGATEAIKTVKATPLARQTILGSRDRVEKAKTESFQTPLEQLLAKFAEPGRSLPEGQWVAADNLGDVAAVLSSPIYFTSDDFTEVIDLKRIVVGMKNEMAAFIENGGSAELYVGALIKRQKQEIAYRDKAADRLNELMDNAAQASRVLSPNAADVQRKAMSEAYSYFLKANASLKNMGIPSLIIPDALRQYQMNLNLDED